MSEQKQIFGAISEMLADVDGIKKERKNQQQGFMFRGIDDVYNAIHPLLAKHKVFPTCKIVSRELTERQTKTGGALFYVNMKCEYTFHAIDGSNVVTEAWGEAMDSGDKASNKCMSVAYKYALFQLLCIPTEAVDPDDQLHQVAPSQPAQKSNGTPPRQPASHLPPGERDPIERAKDIAERVEKRTPDEIYADAKRAIANATLNRVASLRGGIQQYADKGQITAEHASMLHTLLESKIAELEAAAAASV